MISSAAAPSPNPQFRLKSINSEAMSAPTHFAPVILYSDDAKAVHDALLTSGHTELAEKIRQKAQRSRLDKMYAEHVDVGSDDDFDHDDEPVVSQGAAGAYVMVWRWVYKETIRETIRSSAKSESKMKSA
jgi:hypothetical protein